jgi:hypothetical protein
MISEEDKMAMRRRKKASGGGVPPRPDTKLAEQYDQLDTYCAECLATSGKRELQYDTPGGATCVEGHGGAGGVAVEDEEGILACLRARSAPRAFAVREGDRLTVTFAGAKLQIAQYSTVELDGAIYSRTLEPGDDLNAEFSRIYEILKESCLSRAREKLAIYAEEHAAAKRAAGGR